MFWLKLYSIINAALCGIAQLSTYKITLFLFKQQERKKIVINNIPDLAFFCCTFAEKLDRFGKVFA
jgi:hypothetical protein